MRRRELDPTPPPPTAAGERFARSMEAASDHGSWRAQLMDVHATQRARPEALFPERPMALPGTRGEEERRASTARGCSRMKVEWSVL